VVKKVRNLLVVWRGQLATNRPTGQMRHPSPVWYIWGMAVALVLDGLNEKQKRQAKAGVVKAVEASFRTRPMRTPPTKNEAERRLALAGGIYNELRVDKHWTSAKALAHLPRLLVLAIDGVPATDDQVVLGLHRWFGPGSGKVLPELPLSALAVGGSPAILGPNGFPVEA
jgi:hypothetical protein